MLPIRDRRVKLLIDTMTWTRDSEDVGARLILEVAAGHTTAFESLVEQFERRVYNTVLRYVGNRSIAEELTQDVFVRVFKAAPTYEPRAKFETWLHRIIFNLCVNATEYGRRRRALSLDSSARGEDSRIEVAAPDSVSPLDGLANQEVAEAVRRAIAKLPPQQRVALLLSRYQNKQYNEIAETMGVSLEAVKSLLFRARENLKNALEPFLREGAHHEL